MNIDENTLPEVVDSREADSSGDQDISCWRISADVDVNVEQPFSVHQ